MADSAGWHGLDRHALPTVLAPRALEPECYVSKNVSLMWKEVTRCGEEEEDEEDCENINQLSDPFSAVEDASSQEGIDLQVLLEGEHAFNVEDVCEIFSELEEVASSVDEDGDASNVDDISALFTAIEEHDLTDGVDCDPEVSSDDDASNVQELCEFFTELAGEEQDQSNQDWIASLDVLDVSTLFTELEQSENIPVKTQNTTVDSRIFVPQFSVRIEGQQRPSLSSLIRLSHDQESGFLSGPPGLKPCSAPLAVGPPSCGKRKALSTPSVSVARTADPAISETRRVYAAKRRRVNGRFVREQSAFVAITSLQQ